MEKIKNCGLNKAIVLVVLAITLALVIYFIKSSSTHETLIKSNDFEYMVYTIDEAEKIKSTESDTHLISDNGEKLASLDNIIQAKRSFLDANALSKIEQYADIEKLGQLAYYDRYKQAEIFIYDSFDNIFNVIWVEGNKFSSTIVKTPSTNYNFLSYSFDGQFISLYFVDTKSESVFYYSVAIDDSSSESFEANDIILLEDAELIYFSEDINTVFSHVSYPSPSLAAYNITSNELKEIDIDWEISHIFSYDEGFILTSNSEFGKVPITLVDRNLNVVKEINVPIAIKNKAIGATNNTAMYLIDGTLYGVGILEDNSYVIYGVDVNAGEIVELITVESEFKPVHFKVLTPDGYTA